MRVPFFVTGHQITEENMTVVATWCEGHIIEGSVGKFIRVPVDNPRRARETEARIGDTILKSKTPNRKPTFKIYPKHWLDGGFIDMDNIAIERVARIFSALEDVNRDGSDDLFIEDIPLESEPIPRPVADQHTSNMRTVPQQSSGHPAEVPTV